MMDHIPRKDLSMPPRADCLSAAKTTAIVFRRLLDYCDGAEADTWLNSPHPQLSDQTPISLIAAERGGEVYEVLDRLDGDNCI